MSDTNPITKEELITAITSTLAEICPDSDNESYKPVIEFANELTSQIERL